MVARMRTMHLGLVTFPLLFTLACPAQQRTGGGDDSPGGPDASTEVCGSAGATRCQDQEYQTCQGGSWQTTETCTAGQTCYSGHGCAECDPSHVQVCVGNDVYQCQGGNLGDMVMSCGAQICAGGTCGGTPPDDCSDATQLIYVVDKNRNLLSFDPRQNANTFHMIGQLNCPAGPSLDPLSSTSPFSMSVDRSGRAWVLYSSGEIFLVSTQDASCMPSGFVGGSQGFQLFGMGFVSDTAGGTTETLFIAGGAAIGAGMNRADLGQVVPSSYATTRIGQMEMREYSPELTGTGNAELWAYFPGGMGAVAKIDKATGQSVHTYNLPALVGQVTAWAFAHYGGRYYIFVSTADLFGGNHNRVLRLDPAANGGAGQTDTILPDTPYEVVGAGVSTCAPVVVQ